MVPGEPLDLSVLAPHQDRLEQLAVEVGEVNYSAMSTSERIEIYKLAQGEQIASALGVLAQFCVRMTMTGQA